MGWFIGILVGIIILNAVLGGIGGVKQQAYKTITTILAVVVAVGLSTVLQKVAHNFQLLENINNILNPDILVWIKNGVNFLLPSASVAGILNKILFLNSYSAILMIIIFLVANKLIGILMSLIFGLGRVKDKIINKEKKQGWVSVIFGILLGIIKGVAIVAIIYSPIIELLAAL